MVVFRRGVGSHRVGHGLRLVAAMLGMDRPTTVVFVDGGTELLRAGAVEDPVELDYLTALSDLAGLHALRESLEGRVDLNPELDVTLVGVDELAEMMGECGAVVAF